MKVGLDLLEAALPSKTGIGVYAHDLAQALWKEPGPFEFLGFVKRGMPHALPAGRHAVAEVCTWRENRTFWAQIALPLAMRRGKLDLLHVPGHRAPLNSGGIPIVATMHDLAYSLYPESFRTSHRRRLRFFTEGTIRRARRLITGSEQTKRDLMRLYGVPENVIDVIPHGVSAMFTPIQDHALLTAFRKRWKLPERYVLHVGSLQPRKNLIRLLRAWRLLRGRGTEPAALVLIGKYGWGMRDFFSEAKPEMEAGTLICLGYVPDEEMPLAMNAAQALVMPSLYEGFGFPVLEAMACGVPVACSRISSLPEVAGDCAEFFNPFSEQDMAQALQTLLEKPSRAQQLAQQGLLRAGQFTWKKAAGATILSYRKALGL